MSSLVALQTAGTTRTASCPLLGWGKCSFTPVCPGAVAPGGEAVEQSPEEGSRVVTGVDAAVPGTRNKERSRSGGQGPFCHGAVPTPGLRWNAGLTCFFWKRWSRHGTHCVQTRKGEWNAHWKVMGLSILHLFGTPLSSFLRFLAGYFKHK